MFFEKEKLHCDIIHILSAEELMLFICGVGEDSWESLGLPGDQTSPKGNQPWIFIGRTDAEAEAPILWPPDVKSRLIGKDPDAGKDWRKAGGEGTREDEMVGWHHWLNGHEIEQTPGDGEGLWSLLCSYEVAKSWTRVSNWTMTTCGVGHGPALQLDLGLVKPILELWPPSCKIICISLSHGVCGNWLELQ